MSFGWIFALVIGAFILFLAIFISIKFIKTEGASQDAFIAKDISVLLNPLETGFEEGKTTTLQLGTETRIYNLCENDTSFGKQKIRTSQQSFGKWTESYAEISSRNKYIFSGNLIEGKNFYLFSKPFDFPFKVADLIFILPADKTYCFVNIPEDVATEIKDLRLKNIVNATSSGNCPSGSQSVCFNRAGCDIVVNRNSEGTSGSVTKNRENMDFNGNALMYGAIFSDVETYECQIKRLMARTSELASIYEQKADFVASKGCNTNLNLIELKLAAEQGNFAFVSSIVENIREKTAYLGCRLW